MAALADSDLKRFLAKVALDDGARCWEWTAALSTGGYGRFQLGGRNRQAHRVSYEHFVGPIPDGLTIDHLCRNLVCVNYAHLEPVTNRENLLRGEGFAATNSRKTHCPAGHPYDAENTYVYRSRRCCRTCQRLGQARRAAERRAAA